MIPRRLTLDAGHDQRRSTTRCWSHFTAPLFHRQRRWKQQRDGDVAHRQVEPSSLLGVVEEDISESAAVGCALSAVGRFGDIPSTLHHTFSWRRVATVLLLEYATVWYATVDVAVLVVACFLGAVGTVDSPAACRVSAVIF